MNRRSAYLALLALTAVLTACQKSAPPPAAVSAERLLNADSEPGQWLTYGGTYAEQRFSKLSQINRDNVKTLGLSWFADFDTNLQQTATPLFIDGVLYVSTAWSKVYAFDAKTRKVLWQYDPKVPGEWGAKVCCGLVNRGIAALNGKIYVGTLDARLVALDAKTGKEVWSTVTLDEADRNDPLQRYSITMAPRVVKGNVVIGASGAEFGVRGWIAAYNAETGKQAWRFFTVPGDPSQGFENDAMKKAAETWSGDWWKVGGGGTVWDSATYDPKTDLIFFGTGNGTPWNQEFRDPKLGDNLYLCSIIAIKAETGEYVWHYQQTPADTWDYDAVGHIAVADVTVDGKERHVLMQASKNGFFYMHDAATGELLRATAFVETNWAKGVDMKTGRPIVVPESRYQQKSFNLHPGVQGAHGWHAMAFDPSSGLMYIPTQDAYFPMVREPNYKRVGVGYNLGLDFRAPATYYKQNPAEKQGFISHLQAWDPVAGKTVWRGEENEGPTGGALATAAGLIFQGGGVSREFRAYDAKTGEKLWKFDAQTAVLAPPIAYELDGQQYIAVSVGGQMPGGYFEPNYSRLLVFALNGNAALPPNKEFVPPPLNPPANTASAEVIAAGGESYGKYCAACHGQNGQTRGATFPNLMLTPLLHTQAGFDQVVLHGVRKDKGMASFEQVLDAKGSEAVRAYIVSVANEAKNAQAQAAAAPRQQHE